MAGFRLERAQGLGVWEELAVEMPPPTSGPEFTVLDVSAPAGDRSRYRLEVRFVDGTSLWAGPVEATRPAAATGTLALRLTPNPASGPVAVTLTLPRAEHVSLAVYDLSGKLVAALHDGLAPAGTLELRWEGRSREGRPAPAGLYWVRARLGGRELVRRLARVD